MRKYLSSLIAILASLLCACSDPQPDDDSGSDYPTEETFALIDQGMSYMNSDPARAHRMLDSIAGAGLMTRERCEYFHAMVMFNGECKFDSALMMCDYLLDAGRFGNDRFLEEELCVLASNITSSNGSHLSTLRYANRGIALCHGDERMRGDEVTLMARVGEAEEGLGRNLQARETFDRAYQMLKGTSTFADLVALISLQKRQMGLYCKLKDYDTLISTCHEIEQLVDRFDRDPSFVGQRPETMQESGAATKDFADFYRVQMYALLARTFRLRIEQGLAADISAETDSVRTYVNKLLHNDGALASKAQINAMHEMQFLGLKAEFDHIKPLADEIYLGDSLVNEYVDYLALLADDAASRHDVLAGFNYLKRALVVSDSISQHEMMHALSEQMAINMVQEQQLARQDAENQVERQNLTIRLLSIMLIITLIAGLSIGLLWHKNRKNREILKITRQNLAESKKEVKALAKQLEDTKAEKTIDSVQALYERIVKIMEERKLYLIADLDIKMLAEAALSSRPVVSACINRISGKSFRQWLSEYRLTLFVQMLKLDHDTPVDELAVRCGYQEQSTFRRQFKEKYGMTALKYRKNMMPKEGRKKTKTTN